MMAEVVAQAQNKVLPRGLVNSSLDLSFSSIFISSFLFSFLTMSAFAGINTGAKDLKPIITKEAMEAAPHVQVVEAQIGIYQAL